MVVEGCAAGTSSPNFNHWQPIKKPYFPVKNASAARATKTKKTTPTKRYFKAILPPYLNLNNPKKKANTPKKNAKKMTSPAEEKTPRAAQAQRLTMSSRDRAMLNGDFGAGVALAMRVVSRMAHVMNAPELIDVSSAHIDGCLYHGQASLDFVERFVADHTKVAIPTTLNVGSLDLIHPELYRGDPTEGQAAQRLMQAHIELGCESTFTCAPYQLTHRPALGEQIAWAESNAIVFANSVLGARTNRYGDFLDLAAAITGRAPHAGLHVTANRAAQIVFQAPPLTALPPRESTSPTRGTRAVTTIVSATPPPGAVACPTDGTADGMSGRDVYFAALGFLVGKRAGTTISAITGLPDDTTEDELKALGAAAASSGAVGLFHAVGITPEAPTLDAALQGRPPERVIPVSLDDLKAVRNAFNNGKEGDPLTAVSLGTPHFSLSEFTALHALLKTHNAPLKCDFYVNTSRFILWQLETSGVAQELAARNIQIVVDTCTYITPVMKKMSGLIMTNSGKWAHYAPANIGVQVAFGSMAECVRSAVTGRVSFNA
jgi:predicted aconitase